MSVETDEVVWKRVTAGDARAYGQVWDRHRDRVFRHLLGIGQPANDAEDAAAIVFLELWRRRRHVRFVDGSLLPWLLVTARNVSRNLARAQRRYSRFLAALPTPATALDPLESILDEDSSAHILRRVVATARAEDGDLLAMTAIEGLSVREAADAVGISESAARTRLSRFRAQLRTELTIEEQGIRP